MHILLVEKCKESSKNVTKSKAEDGSHIAVIFQLIVITTSNVICWFPVNGIYIAAMFLSTYPIDLIIWKPVICLPLNSIINPLVFIIVACRKYIKNN